MKGKKTSIIDSDRQESKVNNLISLSIVIPIFNSEEIVSSLIESLENISIVKKWEVIFVDDGSHDNSHSVLERCLSSSSLKAKLIRHSRNYGEQQAILTGYRYSSGEYIVNIDDDLQNPPSEALKLWQSAKEQNLDVVFGINKKKRYPKWRIIGSKFAYKTARYFLDLPNYFAISSFRCVRLEIAQKVVQYLGPYPYIDGLISQYTQKSGSIEVEHHLRLKGQSNYNLRKLISLWLNIITSHSIMPLRLATLLGMIMALIGLLGVIFVLIDTIILGIIVPGWASLISVIMLFGGMQCLLIGVAGEYLGRILLTVGGKPQSNIRSIVEKNI